MALSIAMFDAGAGDAFVVQAARSSAGPWTAVIDGGPPRTPDRGLKQHLWDIASPPSHGKASAYVDLLAVTHIDSDHIGGAIDLLRDTEAVSTASIAGFSFGAAWHNGFADLTADSTLVASAQLRTDVQARLENRQFPAAERECAVALVASVGQGEDLSGLIARNRLGANPPFGGLITQGAVAEWGSDLRITVVGPTQHDIDALRTYWNREVNQNINSGHRITYAAASLDRSVPNLSSLVFILEHGDRRVLFTGDARGDRVVQQLRDLGLLDYGTLHVDAIKLPHHGSERSCTDDLFQAVTADHYLISGDGSNGNPSAVMADRLCRSRPGEPFSVWLTHDIPPVTQRFLQDRKISVFVRDAASSGVIVDL